MLSLDKYSIGTGDRFVHQGKAQLAAVTKARKRDGLDLSIVWNKSHREHVIIDTFPSSVRIEADNAVSDLGWKGKYFVDADHINLSNVDLFLDASDFFTIDVADYTGQKAKEVDIESFVEAHQRFCGELTIEGLDSPLKITEDKIRNTAEKYLLAVQEAGNIYRHIEMKKGAGNFVTEVSMDETDAPQRPEELLFILSAIAAEKIPAQTIAPKFTGRFNKGVDFVGDVDRFNIEFEEDVCVINYCIKEFGLSPNLKLSVHSGSDKFSIYPGINSTLKKHDVGLHIKTAGTTWLEELIGLASSGEAGLNIAKAVYYQSLDRIDELCEPYASVIDIDVSQLPDKAVVAGWSGTVYAEALKHDQSSPNYNHHFRQLLHVGYKIAAEMGHQFTDALKKYESTIAPLVTQNLYQRHIKPAFVGKFSG
ncbi:MAG: tagaturonate epimerase family protein [Desulfobacterales bacterium]|nr:tagaturonate epimerase family protein [Desulfobacterales bacterium]